MSEFAVGKGTAISNQSSMSLDVDMPGTPGKATLAQNMSGGPAKEQGGFHLSKDERSRLETDFRERIGTAFTCYTAAAGQVYDDYKAELRAKAAELPVLESLFIAALGAAGGIAVKMLTPTIVTKTIMGLGIMKHPPELPEQALELFTSPVDVGKDMVKTDLSPTVKDKGTDFINAILAAAAARVQHVKEVVSRTANDGALAKMFAAADASLQTPALFKEQIEAKLQRFLGSHASSIGRELNNEKRVGWIGKKGGQLAYVGQSFNVTDTSLIGQRKVYNGESALSLADDSTPEASEHHSLQQETLHAAPSTSVYFIGFVEPDMVEPALATHEAKWQAEPEVYPWSIITGGAK